MDTNTQIERLIELAIVQRTELKRLVEELPQLKEHLSAEIERTFEETEPQLRAELEEWTSKQAADKTAALGVALESKIASLAKSLEESAQAKFSAVLAARDQNADLLKQAEERIAVAASEIPGKVKEIVTAELARFPRAGEIDRLRKEFQEPRGLNPRGKWLPDQTYNKLDLVTWNGDSYVSNTDGNKERPGRNAANWTLSAARGTSGGGPADLSALTAVPSNGTLLIGSGTSWVNGQLTAGAGVSITVGPGAITISATDGDITLDDGTAASPSLHFTNDPDTGIYRPAANTLGISVSGTQIAYFDANGITTVGAGATFDGSVHAANGNANNPSLSFTSDQDTGFFRHQPNEIGVSLGGTQKATLTSTTFTITPNLVVSGTGSINGTSIPASKTLVVTTDKLSALASTSSSELAGVISDETGTGALVFANTPTLVTPVIGAATGTSLTVTGNVTASDAILGSSGPSVKSTLSARAPRQGLVFDGTAVNASVASVPVFGTGDFTLSAVFFAPNDLTGGSRYYTIMGGTYGATTCPVFGYYNGTAFFNRATGPAAITATCTSGKAHHVVVTRSGETYKIYVDGVVGYSGAYGSNENFSAAITTLGQLTNEASNSVMLGTIAQPLIYNRALSASEVVALYEAGAPSGADYWTGGTANLNSSLTADTGSPTIGGPTSVTFSSGSAQRVKTPNFTYSKGVVRVSGTAASFSGTQLNCYLAGGTGGTITANGAFSFLLSTGTNGSNAVYIDNASGATGAAITNLAITPLGLLLAPDAAQAGGGLVWYDTSGNAANITLPSSGVSWNVPSSRVLGGNWTNTGTLSATGSQTADTVPYNLLAGGNKRIYIGYNTTGDYGALNVADTGVAWKNLVLNQNGGNVLVGGIIDNGQKFQVSGDAAISGALNVTGNAIAGSGAGFLSNLYYASGWKYVGSGLGAGFYTDATLTRFLVAPNNTGGAGASATPVEFLQVSGTGDATFAGKIQVGTSSVTGAQLVVVGPASASARTAAFLSKTAGDKTYSAGLFSKYDNDSTTSQVFVQFSINNDGTANGQINANGASQAAFGSWSDARLKKNIVSLGSQWNAIKSLRPVEFDYIESEGGGHQIGFIAQEVQPIYSDVVGTRPDGMFTLSGMGKNEARLIKALQEAMLRIETLEAKLA